MTFGEWCKQFKEGQFSERPAADVYQLYLLERIAMALETLAARDAPKQVEENDAYHCTDCGASVNPANDTHICEKGKGLQR
jgi:hypothetical protein